MSVLFGRESILVPTERICNHTFLPRLIGPASTVLDLGANRGEFSLGIIERFHCRVISAEPISELCDKIPSHPLLELHKIAVGGKNQNVAMTVFPGRSEHSSIITSPKKDNRSTVRTVSMVTLADFRQVASVERVDLLKVDIEGAEIELFGACDDNELKRAAQITVEFHDFLYRDLHNAVGRIRNRMADLGFWVLPFSLDSSDVLFVNRQTGVSAAEVAYLRTFVRYGKGLQRRLTRSARSMGLLASKA
jgi:FkbM family methyltransferase